MENLGRDSLCEALAGDTEAEESMLNWFRSRDCFRDTQGGLGGGRAEEGGGGGVVGDLR